VDVWTSCLPPIANLELALLGVLYKGEPCPQQGGRVQLLPRQVRSLTLNVMEKEMAGFGREGQRMTDHAAKAPPHKARVTAHVLQLIGCH